MGRLGTIKTVRILYEDYNITHKKKNNKKREREREIKKEEKVTNANSFNLHTVVSLTSKTKDSAIPSSL